MQLANEQGEESSGGTKQIGRVFEAPASLTLESTLVKASQVRLCIFGAKIRGEVVFDETYSLIVGDQSFDLGYFEEGPFVIRVYADGKLVENISFLME